MKTSGDLSGVLPLVTEPWHEVFLSYASQDAEAARKICEALRGAGVQVFLDQSELRGGDAWDQKIRQKIHDCALFIPMVSQHTQERLEGYFRHEWKLAVERTHHMAEQKPFLVPVVVDGTRDQEAFVPDAFKALQWTRLPGGETPPAFVERIKRLLSPELSPLSPVSHATGAVRKPLRASRRSRPVLLMLAAVLAALAYFVADKFWIPKHVTPAPAAFAPPPHSIAVLPFVNMSGDASQEYFSEGLTEELLNSLSRINELQVAARTSSFSFQGEHPDIATVAHKLNVAAVLEGSVRRSEHTVRITAQLVNASTGFHLWSQTYDRDLGDVLKLQTEIANAVAGALQVTLLGDLAAKIELGGTRNPAAFDAYLRGSKAFNTVHESQDVQTAISAYTEAIRLDPHYALAFAARSIGFAFDGGNWATTPAHVRASFDKALADARSAVALAPDLGEGHWALAGAFESLLDFPRASEAFERAVVLAPGNAQVLTDYGRFAAQMGRTDAGVAAARRAVMLDPLNFAVHRRLGDTLLWAHRYREATAAYQDALALDPNDPLTTTLRGYAYFALGDYQSARAWCEIKSEFWGIQWCLALTYNKLGRHADAEAMLDKLRASGDTLAYQYAIMYAQWGDTPKALSWLETALRLRDPGLAQLKTEPGLDPLRKEPRFQAIERELKFPN